MDIRACGEGYLTSCGGGAVVSRLVTLTILLTNEALCEV